MERLINLNEYLDSYLGETLADKIDLTGLNEILLNSMPTGWYKQAYIQGFDCESISLKKAVNIFEHTEITESIYEGVVEPYYKKPTWEDSNRACHGRNKIGEAALSNTCPATGESARKRQKQYVDRSKSESEICLIHGPGHSYDGCKVLRDFVSK